MASKSIVVFTFLALLSPFSGRADAPMSKEKFIEKSTQNLDIIDSSCAAIENESPTIDKALSEQCVLGSNVAKLVKEYGKFCGDTHKSVTKMNHDSIKPAANKVRAHLYSTMTKQLKDLEDDLYKLIEIGRRYKGYTEKGATQCAPLSQALATIEANAFGTLKDDKSKSIFRALVWQSDDLKAYFAPALEDSKDPVRAISNSSL